ncbi:Nif3-like dinuclear metal center hexameric protein, partial [Flavobacteriaceae bacterium]|nr:Nif3-like dinuclear metal center hexameric protein [Flavobacteriaceae bacterium]
GLLVGNSNEIINKAIITIDTTEEVVDEAIKNDCNLIITFHPIIFDGLKNITEQTYVERIVFKAIRNNINIYSIHTNLDNNPRGVNYKICQKLELNNTKFLISKNEGAFGMGMIGELNKELSEIDFFNFLKSKMNIKNIKHSTFIGKKINKVAVLGGSGGFAIKNAIEERADCYVTSDLKYHDYFKADNKILLADIGHYESEQFTKELILEYLNEKIPKFACIIAKSNTNPVNYF